MKSGVFEGKMGVSFGGGVGFMGVGSSFWMRVEMEPSRTKLRKKR